MMFKRALTVLTAACAALLVIGTMTASHAQGGVTVGATAIAPNSEKVLAQIWLRKYPNTIAGSVVLTTFATFQHTFYGTASSLEYPSSSQALVTASGKFNNRPATAFISLDCKNNGHIGYRIMQDGQIVWSSGPNGEKDMLAVTNGGVLVCAALAAVAAAH